MRKLGLEGDSQADRSVHGGPLKAVYAYPSEHYPFWEELLGKKLEWGAFGENITTVGVSEESLHPGDELKIGDAILAITKPRFPCFKLGIRMMRPDFVKMFEKSDLPGFYLSVTQEGSISAGDTIEVVRSGEGNPTIASVYRGER